MDQPRAADALRDDATPLREALLRHYELHGLPPDGGADRAWFWVRIGPLRIPLPNPGIRKEAVVYHDIHHLATGFNTVFSQGEMIIAGHEIGAGCGRFVVAWIINLWALALGTIVMPRRIFRAFARGRRCLSLYRHAGELERFMGMTVGELKQWLGLHKPAPRPTTRDRLWFAWWCAVAWTLTLCTAALAVGAAWGVWALVAQLARG
jgi:hypothetical protein